MIKKTLAVFVTTAVLVSSLAVTPVFAQQQQQGGSNGGFFGMFVQLFSHMFGGNGQQTPGQPQGQDLPSGTPSGVPSGTPLQGEENRLQGLVTAGKLTQTQAQEVTTEVSKIQAEIQAWATSTGVNAAYVYGALRGPGMSGGLGQGGAMPSGTQARPGFTPGGQGGYTQQGGQQGGLMGPRGNR